MTRLAESLRYRWDRPEAWGLCPRPAEAVERRQEMRRRNLASAVLVSPALFPEVGGCLERVAGRVAPGTAIEAYVFSSPVPQAYSYGVLSDGSLSLGLGSALIERLRPDELAFAVAHELAHCLLGHDAYPLPEDGLPAVERLNRLALVRAREISADRVGLVACGSSTAAFRAMLKLATGLSEEHIRFDVATYLEQARELRRLGASASAALSTHPDFTARVRCLLLFEMSQPFLDAAGRSGEASYSSEELDSRAARELAASEGPVRGLLNRTASRDALLWITLAVMLADGRLSRQEQAFMENRFGPKETARAVEFARSATPDDLDRRLGSALDGAARLAPASRQGLLADIRSIAPRSEGAGERVRALMKRVESAMTGRE